MKRKIADFDDFYFFLSDFTSRGTEVVNIFEISRYVTWLYDDLIVFWLFPHKMISSWVTYWQHSFDHFKGSGYKNNSHEADCQKYSALKSHCRHLILRFIEKSWQSAK